MPRVNSSLPRLAVLLGLAGAACNNTTGATPATQDDATVLDSQLGDATPDVPPDVIPDAAADVPTSACAPVYTGSIPGATLDLSQTPCVFSISAAKGVFSLPYKIHVASAQKLSVPATNGCNATPTPETGAVVLETVVAGGGQKWCVCDVGLCQVQTPPFTPTIPGDYTVDFTWDGKNWFGPSDTGNQPGPAFPTGTYEFRVSIAGKHQHEDGTTVPFAATAVLPIELVP